MKPYDEALKAWFLKNAIIPDLYGGKTLMSDMVMEHLRECGLSPDTKLPELGTVEEFAGTFTSNERIASIVLDHWQCNCGRYARFALVDVPPPKGHKWMGVRREFMDQLAVVGISELGEIIKGVIEAGRE